MMDDMLDEDDEDEEVEEEVDKVVDELIFDIIDRTPAANTKVPAAKVQQPAHVSTSNFNCKYWPRKINSVNLIGRKRYRIGETI
jgi:hypothetical protein